MFPDDMDYMDKLRLTRCYVIMMEELTSAEYDRDCLAVMLDLLDKTIAHIEFNRRI